MYYFKNKCLEILEEATGDPDVFDKVSMIHKAVSKVQVAMKKSKKFFRRFHKFIKRFQVRRQKSKMLQGDHEAVLSPSQKSFVFELCQL